MKLDPSEADLTEVFDTLVDAMSVFRGSAEYKHPRANFRGCCIETPKDARHIRKFSFVDRKGQEVIIELNLQHMFLNPVLYFDHLMHHIAEAMKQINAEGNIWVPSPRITGVNGSPQPMNYKKGGIAGALDTIH